MNTLTSIIKSLYIRSTGYSYTNLGRLFLRLFVGIMLIQFGVRQLARFFELRDVFPAVLGMSHEASLVVMIVIELVCSLFIMCGFLTRLMLLPPFAAMAVACYHQLHDCASEATYMIDWQHEGYLPVMFMGIFFFLLLVGPGKISCDYFISLHIIHTEDKSEAELEEV